MYDKYQHERIVCERTYTTLGPFWIEPASDVRTAELFRVMDSNHRRLTKPLERKEAGRLCDLLNEVFDTAFTGRCVLAFTGRYLDGIDFLDHTTE